MDMKKAALAVVGLAVGFVAGYGTGRVSTGTPINPLSGTKGSYEEGYAAAVKVATESGVFPPLPTELSVLSGKIVSADKTSIVFDADLIAQNPLLKLEGPTRRTILLGTDTKIVRIEEKNSEELAAAQDAFAKAMATGEPVPPPSPVKQVPYTEPLKAGDMIMVEAATNILQSTSFSATLITVLP
ncbi:MAG: hypothetical protein WC866_02665 [Patescibacteria group bacterium]|jgi:hypothetical protein